MATEVKVPTTGNAGEPAVVLEWHAKPGDAVTAGTAVVTLETAKAAVEVEAPVDGVLLQTLVLVGDDAEEFAPLFVIGEPGEEFAALPVAAVDEVLIPTDAVAPVASGQAKSPAAVARNDVKQRRVSISPRARRLAQSLSLDIESIEGTGPRGRVLASDVEAAGARTAASRTPEPTVPEDVTGTRPMDADDGSRTRSIPVRGARRVTAQRMHASLSDAAQVTITRYAEADVLFDYAARLKDVGAERGDAPIGLNDLLMFAVARTVVGHPAANAWFGWDAITEFDDVNLGFAVDTGRALLVPVIRRANELTLAALAGAAHDAIERAKAGKTPIEELEGGTFTVSNLGGSGVHWFTPVLNPPQMCILGVGSAHRVLPGAPAVLPLSLTFDHRGIDGRAAAAVLTDIAQAVAHIDVLAVY